MGFGYGRFDFLHALGAVVWGIASLATIAVAIALIFLLVRFLLVATTAAKIYVAQNTPATPVESVAEQTDGSAPTGPPAV